MKDGLGRTYYKCLRCGHIFKSKAKRPQCGKCKSRDLKEIDEDEFQSQTSPDITKNHQESQAESQPESPQQEEKSPELAEDLTKDKAGEKIIEKPKKKIIRRVRKKEGEGKGWSTVNILLILGAVGLIGYLLYKRFTGEKKERKEETHQEISSAWSNLME